MQPENLYAISLYEGYPQCCEVYVSEAKFILFLPRPHNEKLRSFPTQAYILGTF